MTTPTLPAWLPRALPEARPIEAVTRALIREGLMRLYCDPHNPTGLAPSEYDAMTLGPMIFHEACEEIEDFAPHLHDYVAWCNRGDSDGPPQYHAVALRRAHMAGLARGLVGSGWVRGAMLAVLAVSDRACEGALLRLTSRGCAMLRQAHDEAPALLKLLPENDGRAWWPLTVKGEPAILRDLVKQHMPRKG